MADLAQLPRSVRGALLRARRPSPQRYMAFLSYSHQDSAIADWLHETLEEFKVPPQLVGRLTDQGPVPKKLAPIFRDRQELAAAADLNEEIEDAIEASRFLIILCSPAAAKSRWINEEISSFKRVHREDRILAAIVDGEPFASDIPGREDEECFPAALRFHFDSKGRPTKQRAEPVAADLREHADGRKMGMLKIAAGMLGVGLDDLAQREAQRRNRRLYIVTAASIAGMLFTSGLAYTAIDARDEARDQRREAEGLIGFMLGDLRQKVEPIGRLDLLDSVGSKALSYYEGQNKSDLSDESLSQRSRALTLMGEMAFMRGDLDGALARYREAMEGTAEAVRRAPDKPQNLFDHAQNVFWVGYVDYRRGDLGKAAQAFREYRKLADRMIALSPANADYKLERISADTNLGTVLMEQRQYRAAADVYQQSLIPAEALVAKNPENLDYQKNLTSLLAWLADAREYSGLVDEAVTIRQRQLALLTRLGAVNKDADLRRKEMTARRALARLFASKGELQRALEESRRASALVAGLAKIEPNNTDWMQWGASTGFEHALLELAANRPMEAKAVAQSACDTTERLVARDNSVSAWRTVLALSCLKTKARIALRTGAADEAISLARQAVALGRSERDPVGRALSVSSAEILSGEALLRAGERDAAKAAFERALAGWPKGIEERPSEMAERATLLRYLGRASEAAPLEAHLRSMGYRHPDFRQRRG